MSKLCPRTLCLPAEPRELKASKIFVLEPQEVLGRKELQVPKDGSVDLFHLWSSYKADFGSESEFWLGNENLHKLTLQGEFPARSKGPKGTWVELEDFNGNHTFAPHYVTFCLMGEANYSLQALSKFSEAFCLRLSQDNIPKGARHGVDPYGALQEGTAGRDSLSFHSRKPFTTDTDHDSNGNSCSEVVPVAWWYESCYQSNLNSHYAVSEATAHKHGINWASSVVGHPYHRVPMMLH
ncbi:LOW QUALITY PROTEIN: ficolin-3 [Callospermophilus lateralis]